jgi:2-keto-3-deoxy-L-rhamnonate aldolase RhmA
MNATSRRIVQRCGPADLAGDATRSPTSRFTLFRWSRLVRARWMLTLASFAVPGSTAFAQGTHHNPLVDLLAQKKPVFGLYAPANPRTRPGQPAPANAPAPKTPVQLAQDALAYTNGDYIFDGSMEGNWDSGYASFAEFVKGMAPGGRLVRSHPLVVKMHEIAPNPALAREHIGKQLNLGVSAIVFVGVESADEVRQGLAMMRFPARGGTRPDDVGGAPALWGMSEKEYREKADLWPLNPKGELVNWTIVETKEGLAKVREIAAVKGIGVLFPGAGTLRGVFTSTDASGKRVLDEAAWEASIQQVLAACKEFNVACGYPANLNDIEMRMKQGFSVFVIGWGESGMKTIELGKKVGGR